MADTSFQTDEFLKLLTDALRAGPGSPAWHDALARLRTEGLADTDEYRLLCTVREHLETGRDYRSIRAGAGFTRKLFDAVEIEASRPARRISTATLIAMAGGAVLVTVVVIVGMLLLGGSGTSRDVPDSLRRAVMAQEILASDFASADARWREFGSLPVKPQGGLRAAIARDLRATEYHGGGLITANSIAPGQMFEASAQIHVERPTENLLVQLFVTDDPSFPKDPQAANPKHELVCWIQAGQVKVGLPDDSVRTIQDRIRDNARAQLRLRMDKQFVIVEGDGKEIYAGRHGLAEDRPRFVGLRFQAKAYERTEAIAVQSVRILKP
jgi:hypothetical protein